MICFFQSFDHPVVQTIKAIQRTLPAKVISLVLLPDIKNKELRNLCVRVAVEFGNLQEGEEKNDWQLEKKGKPRRNLEEF